VDGFSQPSHLALGQAERLFSFLSDDLSIRLEAATTLTRRDDRQRPVTVQPTSPPDTFSQPQESFTLTLSLISSVGRDIIVDRGLSFLEWPPRLRLRRILLRSRLWRAIGSNQAGVRSAVVLLAASSAKVAAHPGADRLLTDISTITRERFWEVQYRAVAGGIHQ
jgi:sulfoquinovose isomerase